MVAAAITPEPDHQAARAALAAAFRWCARLDMHEGIANHFSLAVEGPGTPFLMNSSRQIFSRIRASDLLLLNADDRTTMSRPDAPDPTAWGLHGAIRRHLPRAKCLMHVHSRYATALACLADPMLPPINQTAAEFFGRIAVDDAYGGLALEDEGERCARLMGDDNIQVMIMGNHGLLVIGETVAEAFDRMYYFERAAMTYIDVLHTGRPLNILSDEIAAKTAAEFRDHGAPLAALHFQQLCAVLDDEGSDYAA